ncbi:nuclear pore complex protein Nup98-Nup96 [Pseudonaja textilis]|uniref:nuclear pore complex protein Nup98-Nup96 n=1 Tax=Pseudonaja textilis TaxID=8673 RepID=UPI000EA91F8C|nr:nuclear pore complex protein Nup98-Nup96 [Pseudonaja textilis]
MFNKSYGTPFGGTTGGFGTTSTFGQNTGFGTTSGGAFGTSAFGSSNNAGGLFGSTQTKPGGLFGASTFSQPATSSTSTGFGFGTSTGTSSSLFGTASTGGGLFSNQSNAFAQNKPVGFGNFGTSTSSGGLFGTTNTTSNPFGGTSGSLFGSTSFSAVPTGTTIKFNAPNGTDTMVKSGVSTNISTKHQCITAMKEYESKSLEELRLEDYQANRKGPTNPVGAGATPGLFGSSTATSSAATGLFGSSTTNTGFSYGANKTPFGTSTTGFGTGTGGLFGSTQQTPSLFNKPFGQPTTAPNTGFSFTNTSTLGQPNTNTMGLFGAAQPTQTGGLFGTTANTNTAAAFGTGTGLFGQPNTGFGVGGSSLFSNKTGGFGTTTTSAPSFGTTTGFFGFNTNATGNSLFGNKPATGALGPGLGAGFGTALNPGQNSLFGSTQPKLGGTLGTGAFGAPGFNTSTATLGFGAPQPAVALTDPNVSAAQQAVLQQHLNSLTYSPFGDSPLFRNPMSDPKKKEERLKPTNPAAQKALTTPTHYKLTPRPATRVRPKALQTGGSSKSHLFDGLDDDEPSLTNGAFMPKKSIKKLVLKNLNGNSLFSPTSADVDDLASPSVYPENGDRPCSSKGRIWGWVGVAVAVGHPAFPLPDHPRRVSESPFKVHLEKLTLDGKPTDRVYLPALEIQLKHSTVHLDDPCPFLAPNPGVAAIHEYAAWASEASEDAGGGEGEEEAVVRTWGLVWRLCEALWGRLKELEGRLEEPSEYGLLLERRRAFSRWLSRTAAHRIQEEVALRQNDAPAEAVFSYLTGKQISNACHLAQQSGDLRLSLLLSQLVGSQEVRELLALQLADWHQLQADGFIQDERLRIFCLLAGKPVWQLSEKRTINVCSQLDWKRSLGVHLWYLLPSTAPLSKALSVYEAAFQATPEGEGYACPPLPPYLEDSGYVAENDNAQRPLRDVCFHLLKLYSDRCYDLHQLLDPRSVTADPLDHRLSWHLWEALRALNYTHLSEQCQGVLNGSYAAQLEREGLWEWAVFVHLHTPNARTRERAVRELLNRHCKLLESPESGDKEAFLTRKLCVPPEWIYEAKALWAHREGDKAREALYLFKAGHWNRCHQLVVRHLASDAIINENYTYLRGFLEDLASPERCSLIQGWDTAGLVFLDYLRVIEMVSRIQQLEVTGYELEELHSKVISLCGRIELVQCQGAKDRLAQSEMAKRNADILRVVLSLQHPPDPACGATPDVQRVPLRLLAPHISRLPMPEDYALEELRGLTQSYLRELMVVAQ